MIALAPITLNKLCMRLNRLKQATDTLSPELLLRIVCIKLYVYKWLLLRKTLLSYLSINLRAAVNAYYLVFHFRSTSHNR